MRKQIVAIAILTATICGGVNATAADAPDLPLELPLCIVDPRNWTTTLG
jgi:hypothetical protein